MLGAVLIAGARVLNDARWVLSADDFYRPAHQHLWTAMVNLHGRGAPVDLVTITSELRNVGLLETIGGSEALHAFTVSTPAVSRWQHYADLIVVAATGRRLLHACAGAIDQAYEGSDPWQVAELLHGELDGLARHSSIPPIDLRTAEEMADLPDDVMPPWVVEHWLRQGDRTILVAEEGIGKSVLTLQWAMMIAQGINPLWSSHRFLPANTLVIDLENPAYVLRERVRDLRSRIKLSNGGEYHDGLCHVWHRRAGIDLRSRRTQRELDAVFAEVQPSLVVLSPLYKAFRKKSREDHEDVAAELQAILDDFIERFGFSLVIEHHAPSGSAKERDLRPFGSSLWLRWPEYGLALMRDGKAPSLVKVGRFRGDRVRNAGWPSTLKWGTHWPWEAAWESSAPWAGVDAADF